MPEDGRPEKGRMCMSAVEKIERQQAKEKGRTAAWMVGEQLKDMARREPESAELLDKDLDIPEMSIQQAEKKIKAYADAHKTGSFACVTPAEAERILREFYGLNPSVSFADTSPVRGGKGRSRGRLPQSRCARQLPRGGSRRSEAEAEETQIE